MTKDVLIKVRGYQYLAGEGEGLSEDPEVTEMITWGHYYPKGEHHYIRYEEKMEGFSETIDNLIRLEEGRMEVRKKGLIDVLMAFDKNQMHQTNYRTPYGDIGMKIETTALDVKLEEDQIIIRIEYILEMNGAAVGSCRLEMDVISKKM